MEKIERGVSGRKEWQGQKGQTRESRAVCREQCTYSVCGQVPKMSRSRLGRQVRIILCRTLNATLSSDCFQRERESDRVREKNRNILWEMHLVQDGRQHQKRNCNNSATSSGRLNVWGPTVSYSILQYLGDIHPQIPGQRDGESGG